MTFFIQAPVSSRDIHIRLRVKISGLKISVNAEQTSKGRVNKNEIPIIVGITGMF